MRTDITLRTMMSASRTAPAERGWLLGIVAGALGLSAIICIPFMTPPSIL